MCSRGGRTRRRPRAYRPHRSPLVPHPARRLRRHRGGGGAAGRRAGRPRGRGPAPPLSAPPGPDTRPRLVSPLDEEPPRDAIGDPWYEASHVVSVYEHGDEFDIMHDHTGPVGVSVGALSDRPTIHTLHGPFTDQTTMLYRRIARRHWFVAISESQRSMAPENLRWAGVVYNGIPMDRYPFHQDKDDFLFFLGRADEEKAPDLAIEAARRAGRGVGRGAAPRRRAGQGARPPPGAVPHHQEPARPDLLGGEGRADPRRRRRGP